MNAVTKNYFKLSKKEKEACIYFLENINKLIEIKNEVIEDVAEKKRKSNRSNKNIINPRFSFTLEFFEYAGTIF